MSKNHAKIDDFGATGVPKSTEMVPRSAPKVTLEISHEKDERGTKNCEAFLDNFGDFGRHLGQLGAKWRPKGAKMEPKIGPKSMPKSMQKSIPKKYRKTCKKLSKHGAKIDQKSIPKSF